MTQLSATDATAIYAAIVATGALALEIRRWFESGPRLTLSIISKAKTYGGVLPDDKEYLVARVTNRGDLPSTISNFALHEYRSVFHRFFNRSSKSAIVPHPEVLGGPILPHVCQPGTEWSGATTYNQELVDWASTGKLFVAVYYSHTHKPLKRKVNYQTKA